MAFRRTGVGCAVTGAIVAAALAGSAGSASAAGAEVDVYQSETAASDNYFVSRTPGEGGPAFGEATDLFEAWADPAPGLRAIYRTIDTNGTYAVTTDPTGGARGTVQAPVLLGYLAADVASAEANSSKSCGDYNAGPNRISLYDGDLGEYFTKTVAPGPFAVITDRNGGTPSGAEVEFLGYSPCQGGGGLDALDSFELLLPLEGDSL